MSRSQIRRQSGPTGLGSDDAGCTILHIDMDAFYASVELLTRPELVGTPVIVGGSGSRGVVLSATYEARALGVHSAMPMSRARRIAPNATVIEPQHHRYSEVSTGVMAIFNSVTPLVEPLSLDEAFLDIAGAVRRLGAPSRIGELIRARVHDEQGITCSVGVATTKFVAKLASTRAKPDGLLVVPGDEVIEFLHPLPVAALWGVGAKTEEVLVRLGLRTVGDIAHTSVETLRRALGNATGTHLAELSWGRDPRSVTPNVGERSMGAEETFARDIDDPEVVLREFLRLSHKVAARLRSHGSVGRTVAIKVRMADFSTLTRSRTLPEPTDVAHEIYDVAAELYDALGLQRVRIRLVGVRLEGLIQADGGERQLTFDVPGDAPATLDWRATEQAADRLRARYGHSVVQPARLVDPGPGD
jgi:DNA polymerase-4